MVIPERCALVALRWPCSASVRPRKPTSHWCALAPPSPHQLGLTIKCSAAFQADLTYSTQRTHTKGLDTNPRTPRGIQKLACPAGCPMHITSQHLYHNLLSTTCHQAPPSHSPVQNFPSNTLGITRHALPLPQVLYCTPCQHHCRHHIYRPSAPPTAPPTAPTNPHSQLEHPAARPCYIAFFSYLLMPHSSHQPPLSSATALSCPLPALA